MNKLLLASIVLLALCSIVAYGVVQWQFSSPSVEYQSIQGEVQLSLDGQIWGTNDITAFEGQSWYARFYCTGEAKGNVSVTWTLQKFVGSEWADTSLVQTTKMWTLKGTVGQCLYVREYSGDSGNFDWGKAIVDAQEGDRYRVRAEFKAI